MGSISIVRASAGSGKTYLLAVEYIAAAMRHPAAYRSILAVTFTNKATAEMKRRILWELSKLAQGDRGGFFDSIAERTGYCATEIQARAATTLSAIVRDYSSFSVSTIDKFFQRIVRSFFRELGLDLHYKIEINNNETLAEAVDSIIEKSHFDEQLSRKINRIVVEELDAGHRVDPHGAIEKLSRSILNEQYSVTTTADELIEQTFDELKDQYQTATTLLRQKADEACRLIDNAGLSVEDFKSKSSGFAAYFYKVSRSRGGEIPQYGANFEKAATSQDPEQLATKATLDRVRPILTELMDLTAEVMQIYDGTLKLRRTFETIAKSYSRYMVLRHLREEFSSILAARGQLSLSDTSSLIASIIDGADVPFIFERLGSRYSTIFIDEFQDTSLGQWEGFLPLLHEAIAKCDHRCVMLIGDIKQAIYRFRGGDWRLLGGVADSEFEGFIDESRSLTTSWRSERQIVEFNNAVMRQVVDQADAVVDKFLGDQPTDLRDILKSAYADMEQSIPQGKSDGGYVEVFRGDNEPTLQWMVDRVHDIATRHSLCQTAILVRKASEGEMVASALIQAGINIISDEVLTIGSSPTARFIVDLMRYASDAQPLTLASINRYLKRGFTQELTEQEREFILSLRSITSIEAFENIIRYFDLHEREPFYLQSIYNTLYTYCKEESTDINSFVEAWDKSLSANKVALPQIDNAVRILTIHKAKGLEFDAVIVPFFSWGLFPYPSTTIWANSQIDPYDRFNPLPINYSSSLSDTIFSDHYYEQGISSVVDNINLIYVALTRAKSEMYLGLSETPSARTTGALLGNAVEQYLGDKISMGTTKIPTDKKTEDKHRIIFFDRFESYTAPELTIIEQ